MLVLRVLKYTTIVARAVVFHKSACASRGHTGTATISTPNANLGRAAAVAYLGGVFGCSNTPLRVQVINYSLPNLTYG